MFLTVRRSHVPSMIRCVDDVTRSPLSSTLSSVCLSFSRLTVKSRHALCLVELRMEDDVDDGSGGGGSTVFQFWEFSSDDAPVTDFVLECLTACPWSGTTGNVTVVAEDRHGNIMKKRLMNDGGGCCSVTHPPSCNPQYTHHHAVHNTPNIMQSTTHPPSYSPQHTHHHTAHNTPTTIQPIIHPPSYSP